MTSGWGCGGGLMTTPCGWSWRLWRRGIPGGGGTSCPSYAARSGACGGSGGVGGSDARCTATMPMRANGVVVAGVRLVLLVLGSLQDLSEEGLLLVAAGLKCLVLCG
jgi:hypothetical protein